MGTDQETLFPGLIVSRYGKGKVAYIPAALEAMYRQTRFRQLADFLHDVIRYVSPSEVPYEVDGPATLITNMMARDNTRVLHMINWTGCKYEDVQQSVNYVPPVEDVVVRYPIASGKKATTVKLFVPAEFSYRVEHQEQDSVLVVELPRVDNYQGVVVELE